MTTSNSQNSPVHVIVDNREQKLMKALDHRRDNITYETNQLDIADIVITQDLISLHLSLNILFQSDLMRN